MTDRDCVALLQWALPRLGLRWRGFSNLRGQVCKRIGRRMKALGLAEAADYRALVERDPEELQRLDGMCRITISRFYRDRAVFDALRERLLPPLAERALAERRPLRCWSAGCGSGEEPYTLSLTLRLGLRGCVPGLRCEILASDSDPDLIARAQRGCYPPGTLRELPPAWVDEAFEPRGDERCLRAAFREGVSFREEDLRRTMPDGPFDTVLCRNLAFTYFDEPLQRRILAELVGRLGPGGLLVIGGHERLPEGAAEATGLLPAAGALPLFTRS